MTMPNQTSRHNPFRNAMFAAAFLAGVSQVAAPQAVAAAFGAVWGVCTVLYVVFWSTQP